LRDCSSIFFKPLFTPSQSGPPSSEPPSANSQAATASASSFDLDLPGGLSDDDDFDVSNIVQRVSEIPMPPVPHSLPLTGTTGGTTTTTTIMTGFSSYEEYVQRLFVLLSRQVLVDGRYVYRYSFVWY